MQKHLESMKAQPQKSCWPPCCMFLACSRRSPSLGFAKFTPGRRTVSTFCAGIEWSLLGIALSQAVSACSTLWFQSPETHVLSRRDSRPVFCKGPKHRESCYDSKSDFHGKQVALGFPILFAEVTWCLPLSVFQVLLSRFLKKLW